MEKTPVLNLDPADKRDAMALLFKKMVELAESADEEIEPGWEAEKVRLMCEIYRVIFS